MADIRIKDLSNVAAAAADDDYLALDGSVNGSRRILASNLTAKLSDSAKEALLDCFEYVAWADANGQNYYDALSAALSVNQPVSTVPSYSFARLTVQSRTVTSTSEQLQSGITAEHVNDDLFSSGNDAITIKQAGWYKLTLSFYASAVTTATKVRAIGFKDTSTLSVVGWAAVGRVSTYESISMVSIVHIDADTNVGLFAKAEDGNTTFRIMMGMIEPLGLD